MGEETDKPTLQSQDERVMAGLAHISVLVPLMGLIGPIMVLRGRDFRYAVVGGRVERFLA